MLLSTSNRTTGSTTLLLTLAVLEVQLTSARWLGVLQAKRGIGRTGPRRSGPRALEHKYTEFTDYGTEWTSTFCANLPIDDPSWYVESIDYTPDDINPEFRWFLKSVVIFSGRDCQMPVRGSGTTLPVRVNIENLHVDRDNAPYWLQYSNRPYWGVAYNPEVPAGSIAIEDPEGLLGRKMTDKEQVEVHRLRGEDFLDELARQMEVEENTLDLRDRELRQGYMADEDGSNCDSGGDLQHKPVKCPPKMESTEYNIWPNHQFFGQVSIRFESDHRYFHVEPGEGWRNRYEIGEVTEPTERLTGGNLIDRMD
ncbi:hypothetical protein TWF694_010420 [Orbilia ellipsospora]|uniref:Uncharacterized protein n=1 Tax=Orbilia ellipsospora TaxID=2528407 RepID=A0AAV9XAZ4_9PEZI